MKKLLYCAAALATLLFAGSCQKENLEPVADGSVTYTITLADGVQTRGSNGYTEYDLYYEVYKTVDPTELETATPLIDKMVEMTGNTTNIVLELLNDQDYTVLFWANKKGTDYFVTSDLRNVGVKESLANNDNRDAFCGKDQLLDFDANLSKTVELKRPFAQINIATLIPDVGYAIDPQKSLVTVSDVPLAYNVATKESVGPEVSVTFGTEVIPANYLTVNSINYKMVAMNYVLVPAGNIDELYYEITTENGVVSNTIKNVPVKPNYRTNIIGNLLTSKADYTVEIKPGFEDTDINGNPDGTGNMEVLTNGIVKNINCDYEITNANGLVYAIENLFEDTNVTGTFYILNSIDMTGIDFDPATVTGKNVNIVGAMPVVTRSTSTTTTTGITITGLTQPLIAIVEQDASATFSNIVIEDFEGQGAALVGENKGEVIQTGCKASDEEDNEVALVGGIAPIDAGNVTDYENFCKALSSGVPEITLAGDITAGNVVMINRSVVINGNEKTFNTSANRAFRLATSNIEVTINNLDVVSKAVRVGTNDIRGIAIDSDLNSVSLTLNGCSVDFTDASASDWTYAVNVAGNGRGHKVTVEGGTYEGANVINIWGAENTVTVNNATITSLYPKRVGEYLYGACIWVQEKQGSSVYAEGNTFNGENAVVFNLGEGTVLEEKNNIDNTTLSAFEVNGQLYSTLEAAISAAIDTNGEIKVVYDYNKLKSTSIPANKKVTLNLNGKSLSGVDESNASFGLINVGEGAELTVTGPGSISLVATNDRDWNAYSSVISNQRGTLTVNEGVIIEHLGGTDMAYGIDNLTNGKGTSAITTVNGATVKSPYRAIRQFLNGIEAKNELNVKAGSKIIGSNKSIWMQDPSKNANPGTLEVEKGAELDGDVYLSVTAGSTEWPVSVSIAESALVNDSEVLSSNVPEGYAVVNENGIWKVVEGITTVEQLKAFATEVNGGTNYTGQTVYLLADLDLNNEEWTPIGNSTNTFQGTFDGQNHTISNLLITGNKSNVGLFGFTTNGEIKNLTVNNAKVSGRLNVGVVAGTPYTSKYTNIKVTGHVEVNGMSYVGGVGGTNAYANWTDVTVDVDETSFVNANSVENGTAYRTYVGGVCGFNGEGGHTFTNITSNIDVKGSTIDVGGLFGIAHYGNNFVNCSCSADVEIYNAEAAEDAEEMGGIAGVWHNANETKVTFTNCKFTGTLKANITEGVNLSDNSIVGSAYTSTGTGELIIQ